MTVAGLEEIEPPTLKYNANSITAKRVFRLPNQNLLGQFLSELLGQFNVSDGQTVPGQLGQFPGIARLFVSDIDVQSFDKDYVIENDSFGVAQHGSGLRIVVTYATRQWDAPQGASLDPGNSSPVGDLPGGSGSGAPLDEDGEASHPTERNKILCTHSMDYGGSMRELPNSALQWATAHPSTSSKIVSADIRAGVFEGLITHTLTWYRVNRPPWAKIRRAMGRVNSRRFIGYDAETTLFLGLQAARQWGVEGKRHWQLTYKFLTRDMWHSRENGSEQRVTWNHFYRHDFGSDWAASDSPWQRLEEKGKPGRNVYQKANFNTVLFTQAQIDDWNDNSSSETND